jgi:hypothetical protein
LRCFIRSADELSEWVEDIEPDRKGMPVLLKHYLKLGGKILAFNIDLLFSNVVDGLILVDLIKTDIRILERFLGKNEAAAFRQYHKLPMDMSAA